MHTKMFTTTTALLLAGGFMALALPARAVDTFGSNEKYRPRLFARFAGDFVNVPDGMTQDADGNLYLSVPNFINNLYPGCIMKRSPAAPCGSDADDSTAFPAPRQVAALKGLIALMPR